MKGNERLDNFLAAMEDFQAMVSKSQLNMDVVYKLDRATYDLLDEPRLVLEAKEHIEELNPLMRTVLLSHLFRFDLFRALYEGKITPEEVEKTKTLVSEMINEAVEETFKQLNNMSPEDINAEIEKHTLPLEGALEFYGELAREYRERYGTDDPDELKKLAMKSEDLNVEMAAEDMLIYRALKKKKENQ